MAPPCLALSPFSAPRHAGRGHASLALRQRFRPTARQPASTIFDSARRAWRHVSYDIATPPAVRRLQRDRERCLGPPSQRGANETSFLCFRKATRPVLLETVILNTLRL